MRGPQPNEHPTTSVSRQQGAGSRLGAHRGRAPAAMAHKSSPEDELHEALWLGGSRVQRHQERVAGDGAASGEQGNVH